MKKTKLGPSREWKSLILRTCPICKKGNLKPVREAMPFDGVEYEALQCSRCRESIVTMGQLEDLAEKYRKLRKAKEVTFAKWGNSLAVRIPRDMVAAYKLSSGKHGLLVKGKKGIMIIPQP